MSGAEDQIIRALSAVGAIDETQFYAALFRAQAPERFALFVVDERCLLSPLIDALTTQLRILQDLDLYPSLWITSGTTCARLAEELTKQSLDFSIASEHLETTSEKLPHKKKSKIYTGTALEDVVQATEPSRIIFLQPSGGISKNGRRVPVINLSAPFEDVGKDNLSEGQMSFINTVLRLDEAKNSHAQYVIASPLNLLAELFTVRGSGTLLRRTAKIDHFTSCDEFDVARLKSSMEEAFGRTLNKEFDFDGLSHVFIDRNYRGGALLLPTTSGSYLSKFWVTRAARGEGLARDIWDYMIREVPCLFWRSRDENPFNSWYLESCDGMQVAGSWRIFWKGLAEGNIAGAIMYGSTKQEDFSS